MWTPDRTAAAVAAILVASTCSSLATDDIRHRADRARGCDAWVPPAATPTPSPTATNPPVSSPTAPAPPTATATAAAPPRPSVTATPGSGPTIVFDLADGDRARPVVPDLPYTIEFTHWLPDGSYTVKAAREVLVEAPFDELGGILRETAAVTSAPDQACAQALLRIAGASSEMELRREVRTQTLIVDAACGARIRSYEELCHRSLEGAFVVKDGERLVVEVSRPAVGSSPKRSWRYVLTTGPAKKWLVHFAPAFLPDLDERWFAKVNDGGDGFLVTEEEDRNGWQFEPVVLFTYRPAATDNPWIPHFGAGLGMDVTELLVTAGASWIVGDNIAIFAGVAGHQQQRLKGRYHRDQVILESLTPDDLVADTFNANAIVGIGFRFASNPFAKDSTGAISQPTPTATPAAASPPNSSVAPAATPATETGLGGSTGSDAGR